MNKVACSILGVDIGTTGAKSTLFTGDGKLVDSEYCPYPLIYPQEGWVEQNPEDWWNALVTTVRKLTARNSDRHHIAAMSLSTQGGCLVLLDREFRPLTNAVSWLDQRAQETADLLRMQVDPSNLYEMGGWGNLNGLSFPLVFWFREKRPDMFSQVRYCASTVDYLNRHLTGIFAIDFTNLAMTEFLDIHAGDWSDELLGIVSLSRGNVPEIIPSGTVIGPIRVEAARELGLPNDVLVVSGAHDQYCASIGAGAVHNGDCVLSTGTAWVLTVTSDILIFDASRIIHPCIHLLENKYGLLTSVPSGGNSLNWFRKTFRQSEDFESLSREAEKAPAGCDGMLFIPKNTSRAGKSAYLNIDPVHAFSHFTRAVFEGVAFANRKHLETLSCYGIELSTLVMIGGGAKSSLWPQIVADISQISLVIPEQTEAACTGAAMLAATGCGIFSSVKEASVQFSGKKRRIYPAAENRDRYETLYGEFIAALEKF